MGRVLGEHAVALAVLEVGIPEAGDLAQVVGDVVRLAAQSTRDRCRTPMPWANAPNAGFSPEGVRTWLPVHPNYAEGVNVADQERDLWARARSAVAPLKPKR